MSTQRARKKRQAVEGVVRRMNGASEAGRLLRVTLAGSRIGGTERQRATLSCLGLRKRGSETLVKDTPQARGRIRAVAHLVRVREEA